MHSEVFYGRSCALICVPHAYSLKLLLNKYKLMTYDEAKIQWLAIFLMCVWGGGLGPMCLYLKTELSLFDQIFTT